MFRLYMRRTGAGANDVESARILPFNYTGRTVVGRATFELHRASLLKGNVWSKGNGYVGRYGAEKAHEMATLTVNKTYVMTESRKVYAGTAVQDTFIIFYDGLKQRWAKEDQEYLHTKWHMNDRQLRAFGDTNVGTRYECGVIGDSPELCWGLDAYGFSDLERCISYHVALSSFIKDFNDPRCFKLGTPADVFKTISRCWEFEPASTRIVQDIQDFERVLGLIVDAGGIIVEGEGLRHGRREKRHGSRSASVKIRRKCCRCIPTWLIFCLTSLSCHNKRSYLKQELWCCNKTVSMLCVGSSRR